jgi:hypothetical protein
MRSKAEPPADAMRHSPHQLPWGLRCQERNVQQTPLSFARSARDEAGNRDSRSILVSLPRLTANSVLRSARRGRPGCFADLGVQRRGAGLSPDARYQRSQQQDQLCQDGAITTFPFLPPGQQPMGNGSLANVTQREHDTRRSPLLQWRSLPRPSMRRTQQWIQTMMQIYASAARLRSGGAHSYIRYKNPS